MTSEPITDVCVRCLALSELTWALGKVPRLRDGGTESEDVDGDAGGSRESAEKAAALAAPLVPTAEGLEPHPGDLVRAVEGVGSVRAKKVEAQYRRWDAAMVIASGVESGLAGVCMCSARYPEALRHLSDPPPVLWVRGSWEPLDDGSDNAIAMVGTRRPTIVGREAARRIGAGIARSGGTVVSGMALGIDGAAHEGALSVGGTTIAVLAGGADRATPPSHGRLYDRILERGCVVAEMPPGRRPEKWSFPARNRLIAALSRATVVVEAPMRSGALITVEQAHDLGRDVFAVPGSLAVDTCEGTNRMLCDGALAVVDGGALVAQLGMNRAGERVAPAAEGPVADIHRALSRGALSIDELGIRTGGILGPGEIELALLDLELAGWIIRRSDGRYGVVDRWAA
ncbi:MAG: DNA-processing protein DprA [Solirubrobacteraceae bacterium]|nr:DNA-processing protein DprA [Patulibacter sp.]